MRVQPSEDRPIHKEVVVTVSHLDEPEKYFYGVVDTYESGELHFYTNGRLQEGTEVKITLHNEDQAPEIRQNALGLIESVTPYSSQDYIYIYMYNIRPQ